MWTHLKHWHLLPNLKKSSEDEQRRTSPYHRVNGISKLRGIKRGTTTEICLLRCFSENYKVDTAMLSSYHCIMAHPTRKWNSRQTHTSHTTQGETASSVGLLLFFKPAALLSRSRSLRRGGLQHFPTLMHFPVLFVSQASLPPAQHPEDNHLLNIHTTKSLHDFSYEPATLGERSHTTLPKKASASEVLRAWPHSHCSFEELDNPTV